MSELFEEKLKLVTCRRDRRGRASNTRLLPENNLALHLGNLMNKAKHNGKNGLNADLREIDSIYRMIVVAGLRSKQLLRGATPRIQADPSRRRNISIALEEARRGLIPFTIRNKEALAAAAALTVPKESVA
jgi:DNA-directed RNA polymerase subunit K/omega